MFFPVKHRKEKNMYRTKIKLSKTDISVLIKGLEGVKTLCDEKCPEELLWSRDYVNGLIRRLGKRLDDFEKERE